MRIDGFFALAGICVTLVASSTLAFAAGLPELVVPDGLGVNTHFRGAPSRDLDMLAAGGSRFIRMDFTWGSVERKREVYEFGPYDGLTDALGERGIRYRP